MKLKYISATVAVALILPFVASALTAEDIQTQIANLLAQITQLQQQLKQIQTTTPVQPPPDIAPTPPRCPIFTRTLAQGTTGDDVTQLQQYLGVSPTGYFGPMTAKAVSAVQADAGISQVGIVGPATRAWFYRRCGGGGWNQNFTASPTSGAAPLSVTFYWPNNAVIQNNRESLIIDFGDGTRDERAGFAGFANPCVAYETPTVDGIQAQSSYSCGTRYSTSHTYISNGTYTAKLIYQSPPPPCNAPQGAACMTVMQPSQIVGTVTIYVGSNNSNNITFNASPTSGTAPLTVGFTGVTHRSNSTIEFGDGNSRMVSNFADPPAGVGAYPAYAPFAEAYTYQTAGTYTARLVSGDGGTKTVTIVASGPTSGTSINVSSPTSGQNVSQGGTLGISWNSQNAPAGSAVGLWLVRTRPTGEVQLGCPDSNDPATLPCGSINLGLIATRQPTSGSYTWTVPAAVQTTSGCTSGSAAFDCIQAYAKYADPCPQDAAGVCGSNITAGSYQIVAKLYTPANACLGGLCWPNSAPTYLATSRSGTFTIGGSTTENPTFSALPTGGQAPLTVVFRSNIVNDLGMYEITFGDGTSGSFQNNCKLGYGACGLPTANHTYFASGTYTATLKKVTAFTNCINCGDNAIYETVGTVTITVGGSTGGGVPSITGLDAPTTLAVGQTGTWTVRLNTTNTGNLSYSVVWGDENWGMRPIDALYAAAPSIAASGTFTHAYQSAGTYTPKFTVSNSSGSAQTSASVTVGGTLGRSCVYNGQTYAEGTIVPFYPYDGYTAQSTSAIPASAMKMADPAVFGSAMMAPVSYYVRYRCTNGDWVRAYDEYVDPCPRCVVALKPVIYLYPVATQEVAVRLDFNGRLSSTYPAYDPAIKGWRVIAHPDGTLQNIADNREYSYLFWEGENYPLTIDETKGFVVKGSEAQSFLQTKLAALGLTPREYNEFIVFWLPKMEHNPYNFVQFVGSEYVNLAPLSISPKPDSVLRVFMALKPLKEAISVTPQVIQPFERKGFSVVEWGGTELR